MTVSRSNLELSEEELLERVAEQMAEERRVEEVAKKGRIRKEGLPNGRGEATKGSWGTEGNGWGRSLNGNRYENDVWCGGITG